MITVQVNITDNASPALAALISSLTGPQSVELSEQGGIAARNAATKYHREFDQGNGWRGNRYLGSSRPGGGSFGSDVARAWALASFTSDGAVISNAAPFYRHKVEGGTLVPKRGEFLTIPLIPEASGIRASVYQENSGKRLFRPRGKNVLMESTGSGTVRAVYALVRSITQAPWPNALPPSEAIAAAYTNQYRTSLLERLNS